LLDDRGRVHKVVPVSFSNILDDVRKSSKASIVARIDNDVFFAKRAWEWYGIITKKALIKYGISAYYHTYIHGRTFNVDGLTSIALYFYGAAKAASQSAVSMQQAGHALALIGEVAFQKLLVKSDFEDDRYAWPPINVWEDITTEIEDPQVLLGVLAVMWIVTEAKALGKDESFVKRRRTLSNKILNREDIQGLPSFSQAKARVTIGEIFLSHEIKHPAERV
jgi:hypothetical protein